MAAYVLIAVWRSIRRMEPLRCAVFAILKLWIIARTGNSRRTRKLRTNYVDPTQSNPGLVVGWGSAEMPGARPGVERLSDGVACSGRGLDRVRRVGLRADVRSLSEEVARNRKGDGK